MARKSKKKCTMVRKIVDRYDYQFWCKRCKHASNTLYKIKELSYCEDCVPEKYKDLPAYNQRGELINGEEDDR